MRIFTGIVLATALTSTTAFAGGHAGPFASEIGARQAPMKVMAFNLGILGGMAKGEVDYDADAAATAASNLLAAASINQPTSWPAGSDNAAVDGTKALPAIWENMDDFMAKQDAMAEAAGALVEVAGTGLDGLRGGMGGIGRNCGACHKAYRQSDN